MSAIRLFIVMGAFTSKVYQQYFMNPLSHVAVANYFGAEKHHLVDQYKCIFYKQSLSSRATKSEDFSTQPFHFKKFFSYLFLPLTQYRANILFFFIFLQ